MALLLVFLAHLRLVNFDLVVLLKSSSDEELNTLAEGSALAASSVFCLSAGGLKGGLVSLASCSSLASCFGSTQVGVAPKVLGVAGSTGIFFTVFSLSRIFRALSWGGTGDLMAGLIGGGRGAGGTSFGFSGLVVSMASSSRLSGLSGLS